MKTGVNTFDTRPRKGQENVVSKFRFRRNFPLTSASAPDRDCESQVMEADCKLPPPGALEIPVLSLLVTLPHVSHRTLRGKGAPRLIRFRRHRERPGNVVLNSKGSKEKHLRLRSAPETASLKLWRPLSLAATRPPRAFHASSQDSFIWPLSVPPSHASARPSFIHCRGASRSHSKGSHPGNTYKLTRHV